MKNMIARILACLLVTAMLLSCAAMAELTFDFSVPKFEDIFTPASEYKLETASVPTIPYTHESGAIGFNFPAEWTGYEGDTGAMFPTFYAEDGVGNMVITVSEVDGENMVPAFDELKQEFTKQYADVGATVTSFNLTSYGGRSAIECELEYQGIQQTQVMIQPDDYTAMVIFTFTASAQRYIDLVMDSVWMD